MVLKMENCRKPYVKPDRGDEIVITGISGRFPLSENVYALRENLFNKVDMVVGNFDKNDKYPELPKNVGKMSNVEKFDKGYFGINSIQADYMDPLARIALEKTVEAIMDAGYHPSDLAGTNTGVYTAFFFSESEEMIVDACIKDSWMGMFRPMASQWPSYHLQLEGPTITIDTACSGSAYALDTAYTAMRLGKCDRAFVIGVNLCIQPEMTVKLMRTGALSPEGKCKTFDDSADGYARAESIAVLFLEKSKDAKRVYAEVIHIRTNSDGFTPESLTFPSRSAQVALITDVFNDCQVNPNNLTYMEAHGTGTQAGDDEELNAIDEAICSKMDRPLYLGSIKSNMGHSEATAAICSIIKMVIAMETEYIPPNLHYKNPKHDVDAIAKGRLVVVDKEMRLPNRNGLFAHSTFGIGGSNAHTLLRWNPKIKTNNGEPDDDLPRLLCVSSRVSDGVNCILDDFKNRKYDAEYAYLIHQAFRKPHAPHAYRGFGIYNKQGEVRRSLRRWDGTYQHLYFVFGNFGNGWFRLGRDLMKIPLFSRTIENIQKILHKVTDINLLELMVKSSKINSIHEVITMVSMQIGLANIFKEIKLVPHRILGIGTGELVAAFMDDYLTMEEAILSLLQIASVSENCNTNKLKNLDKILPKTNKTFDKWIPINRNKLMENTTKYFTNDIIRTTNGRNLMMPRDATTLIIGGNVPSLQSEFIHLIRKDAKNTVVELLNNLGSLFLLGFDMEVGKLYPTVQLPVSRATPMLSPLIKWNHFGNCNVFWEYNPIGTNPEYQSIPIMPKVEEWSYLLGHAISGRCLFPASSYLYFAWLTLAKILGKTIEEMKIAFEDVRFLRTTPISKDAHVDLLVSIQMGIQKFEIMEGNTIVAQGRVYEAEDEQIFASLEFPPFDESNLTMDDKDVYKELRLRGYNYSGEFRSLKKCNLDGSQALVEWKGNWPSYLDCLLHPSLLCIDTRDLYLPTSIERVIIDAPRHYRAVQKHNNLMPVRSSKELGLISAAGIEMKDIQTTMTLKKKPDVPVLEASRFIPNTTRLDKHNSIRSFVQIILENVNTSMVGIVEVCQEDQELDQLLYVHLQAAMDDTPLVHEEITILTNKLANLERVTIENAPLSSKSNCLILVVTSFLETTEIGTALNVVKEAKGFVISREKLGSDLTKFSDTVFEIICNHINDEEILVLLRPRSKTTINRRFLNLSNASMDFHWLSKLQEMLNDDNSKIVLYSHNEMSGILGFINCLRREHDMDKISCVFIMDDAPNFDPELDFYKHQLDKDMAINVWKNGSWGTYRHLELLESNLVENEHCYVGVGTRGDLSTLKWREATLEKDKSGVQVISADTIVSVYYASLNFKDLMTASGKLASETSVSERIEMEYVQGLEFAGRNSKGERIMGICNIKGMATLSQPLGWAPIPDDWTLEDGATVSLVYSTVLLAIDFSEVKPGQSILIHSATGGVGLAAVNLCLYHGLEIFVTVGSSEKRQYLRNNYPQIKEEHIGNSRDTSFEEMIKKCTKGRGVDYVLNSLAEDKLVASVRCLVKGGTFLEIGKYDLSINSTMNLELLKREAVFKGIAFSKHTFQDDVHGLMQQLTNLVKAGAVKPLPRSVFQYNEVEKAFRYLGTGKHMGKILIKVRDEEDEKVCPAPRLLFKAFPRFYCKPECSYLICGGLGGFGLELADLLVMRGARALVLTSKSGLSNGYQRYRIRTWTRYNVQVITSTLQASTEEKCAQLLELANKLAPLDGIFNLAAVLKDAMFQNQNAENFKVSLVPKSDCTRNLDVMSRKMCQNLSYFVVFSSTSCGRGNLGQTNYGMSNSIMERICEKRKSDGYPALAIQWGAIGDVGLLAQNLEENKEIVIGGTLQQSIESCLSLMDKFLKQNEAIVSSMVVADKNRGAKVNSAYDAVINIIGLNVKTVSMYLTLPELGMDSMTVVEVKQTLERDYKLILTPKDIRDMTLAKLKQISDEIDSKAYDPIPPPIGDVVKNGHLLFRFFDVNNSSYMPLITLKTMGDGDKCPRIWALPGLEGFATAFESLAEKINGRISCLQYPLIKKPQSIEQLAEMLLIQIESSAEDIILLSYSFGCAVVIELLHLLRVRGTSARVICIDGSPHLLSRLATVLPTSDENLFQVTIIGFILAQFMPEKQIMEHKKAMLNLERYTEKIEYAISKSATPDMNTNLIFDTYVSCYNRLKAGIQYKPPKEKLKARVSLFRATDPLVPKMPSDYGLSDLFVDDIDVVNIQGNHVTILESEDLADHINKILEGTKK